MKKILLSLLLLFSTDTHGAVAPAVEGAAAAGDAFDPVYAKAADIVALPRLLDPNELAIIFGRLSQKAMTPFTIMLLEQFDVRVGIGLAGVVLTGGAEEYPVLYQPSAGPRLKVLKGKTTICRKQRFVKTEDGGGWVTVVGAPAARVDVTEHPFLGVEGPLVRALLRHGYIHLIPEENPDDPEEDDGEDGAA